VQQTEPGEEQSLARVLPFACNQALPLRFDHIMCGHRARPRHLRHNERGRRDHRNTLTTTATRLVRFTVNPLTKSVTMQVLR
jgi:hypothetical protein